MRREGDPVRRQHTEVFCFGINVALSCLGATSARLEPASARLGAANAVVDEKTPFPTARRKLTRLLRTTASSRFVRNARATCCEQLECAVVDPFAVVQRLEELAPVELTTQQEARHGGHQMLQMLEVTSIP